MKLGKRSMAVAATGIAVLSIDFAAALGLTSLAMGRADALGASVILRATDTAARTLAGATISAVTHIAGDLVLHGVRETNAIYGTILRFAPVPRKTLRIRVIEYGPGSTKAPCNAAGKSACSTPARGGETGTRRSGDGAIPAVSGKPDITSRIWDRMLTTS